MQKMVWQWVTAQLNMLDELKVRVRNAFEEIQKNQALDNELASVSALLRAEEEAAEASRQQLQRLDTTDHHGAGRHYGRTNKRAVEWWSVPPATGCC